MKIFTILVISLASVEVVTAHSSYETVFAQLDQYCALRYGKGVNLTNTQPRRGKAGIPGAPGRNGERGPPGVVDYDIIDEMITRKIASILFAPDCANIPPRLAQVRNATGGVFNVYPDAYKYGTEVYCDLETDGGGWTVFQRRMDGSENFNRNWNDYVNGFGTLGSEFWMGLEKLHRLTSGRKIELRVDIGDWDDNRIYAKYSTFSVGDASTKYKLNIGGHSGTVGDSLSSHNNMKFSTPDQDNDTGTRHCGSIRYSGWWFTDCLNVNLNGKYHLSRGKIADWDGIHWNKWKFQKSLKFAEMKFRPKA